MNLQEFSGGNIYMGERSTYNVNPERIQQGFERRFASLFLHEEIVESFANKLIGRGSPVLTLSLIQPF